MEFIIESLDEMKDLARKITDHMDLGDVFGLVGDLGAGKTTLVSFILSELDCPEAVSSPTFSLAHVYDSQPRINHLDLYRLEEEAEIESFEFEEYFYPEDSISFIEWPLKAEGYLPRGIIYIDIRLEEGKRKVHIEDNFFERNGKR